jgi:hypothetical protein
MTGGGGGGGEGNSVRAGSVDALAEHVRAIFTHEKARFVLKYRHSDAKLSLRVTDDVKVRGHWTALLVHSGVGAGCFTPAASHPTSFVHAIIGTADG